MKGIQHIIDHKTCLVWSAWWSPGHAAWAMVNDSYLPVCLRTFGDIQYNTSYKILSASRLGVVSYCLCVENPTKNKSLWSLNKVKEVNVTCGQVWWPILRNMCSAFNPSKCTHTAVNTHREHTHTHTPGAVGSWGFGALLKGLTSVVALRVEESAVHSLPPPTIPAGPETRTRSLWVTSTTL